MITLHEYQKPHATALLKALQTRGVAKDGSDTGTGKTPVAAWVAEQFGQPVLVICPKIMISSWENWLRKAKVPTFQVLNYEALRTGNRSLAVKKKAPGGRREYFEWNLKPDVLLIWDEDHMVSGLDTLNSKLSRAATVQKFPQLYLGATSFDGPHKMNALGFALGFHKVIDFKDWCLENGCTIDRFRKIRFGGNRASLNHIHERIYSNDSPLGSRMRVQDLGDSFPKNNVVTDLYTVDAPEQINKCYEELVEELEKLDWKEEEDFDSELTLRLRARQRAELYKIPLLEELILDHLRDGYSVPCFVSFRDSLFALSERLTAKGIDHSIVTGASTDAEKDRRWDQIQDFQKNKVQVILCIDSAGGVGIDLDDQKGNYPRATLINPSDNAVIFKQVLGRAARSSTKSPVLQRIVCAAGTTEEAIYSNLKRKIDNISLINDDDLDPIMPILRKKACADGV